MFLGEGAPQQLVKKVLVELFIKKNRKGSFSSHNLMNMCNGCHVKNQWILEWDNCTPLLDPGSLLIHKYGLLEVVFLVYWNTVKLKS